MGAAGHCHSRPAMAGGIHSASLRKLAAYRLDPRSHGNDRRFEMDPIANHITTGNFVELPLATRLGVARDRKDEKNAPREAVGRRMVAGQDAKTEIFAYLSSKEELCSSRKSPVASSSGAP